MKIVSISGLDGSGKSTQIELLKNYLESQNKRVFYFHAINFSLANKLSGQKKENQKSITKASWCKIFLRKIFLQIDIWRFGLLRNKLRNSGYDYILSDRFFYDSVINIEYLSGRKTFNIGLPWVDFSFYIRINPEVIMLRERVPDQGMEYLKTKYALYEARIDNWNMKVIDGNRDKNVIFEEIKQLIA